MTTTCKTSRLERGAGEHLQLDNYLQVVDSNARLVTYSDDGEKPGPARLDFVIDPATGFVRHLAAARVPLHARAVTASVGNLTQCSTSAAF